MARERSRHPDHAIEKAVRYAEHLGWRVMMSNGHAWGRLLCPESNRDGCKISVWSTPRSTDNHARQIRRMIDSCPHKLDVEESGNDEQSPQPT